LILTAAILHASWNAILRGAHDRLSSVTIMGLVGEMAALPLALALPKTSPQSWRFIALSVTLLVGYRLFLAAPIEAVNWPNRARLHDRPGQDGASPLHPLRLGFRNPRLIG
jgi:hypothetical protein